MIWALFLLTEWERQGLGRLLLERATDWLRLEGCTINLADYGARQPGGGVLHLGWTCAGITEKGVVRFDFNVERMD